MIPLVPLLTLSFTYLLNRWLQACDLPPSPWTGSVWRAPCSW
ncbi:MAG: hypothetical protein U5K56_18205 [Halioglobus sp.]|nr:hypothetical protein [Halioglobus sp.]